MIGNVKTIKLICDESESVRYHKMEKESTEFITSDWQIVILKSMKHFHQWSDNYLDISVKKSTETYELLDSGKEKIVIRCSYCYLFVWVDSSVITYLLKQYEL